MSDDFLEKDSDVGLFIFYCVFQLIYFCCGLITEDQYTNIQVETSDYHDFTIKEYNYTLPYRILLASNIHIVKMFVLLIFFVIFLFVLYFSVIYSKCPSCQYSKNHISSFFKNIHLFLFIIIIDIVPYLFIYPYITQYISYICMPLLWNTGQYLLFLSIFYKIKSIDFTVKSFINSILFSLISFGFYVFGFSKYYFARKSDFTNCFNNIISIILFFFTPILNLIKDYSTQKILKSTRIPTLLLIITLWTIEEIIYIILRLIFISNYSLLSGFNLKAFFYGSLEMFNALTQICALNVTPLPIIGITKTIIHLTYLPMNFFPLYLVLKPYGYILLSTLASVFELIGYILCLTLNESVVFYLDIYPSPQEIEQEEKIKAIEKKEKEIQMSTETPFTPNNAINNQNIKTNKYTKEDYEDVISKLNKDKSNIESEKRQLQNEINSLTKSNSSLNVEINKYKIKIGKLEQDNQKLLSDINEKNEIIKKNKV